jgi:hypothetical protein
LEVNEEYPPQMWIIPFSSIPPDWFSKAETNTNLILQQCWRIENCWIFCLVLSSWNCSLHPAPRIKPSLVNANEWLDPAAIWIIGKLNEEIEIGCLTIGFSEVNPSWWNELFPNP